MVGHVQSELGLIFDGPNYKVVKKAGPAGDTVASHNHPEAHVIFTVVRGEVKVILNDTEEHSLTPGQVLQFDGDHYIRASLLKDSEFVVTLVAKG